MVRRSPYKNHHYTFIYKTYWLHYTLFCEPIQPPDELIVLTNLMNLLFLYRSQSTSLFKSTPLSDSHFTKESKILTKNDKKLFYRLD